MDAECVADCGERLAEWASDLATLSVPIGVVNCSDILLIIPWPRHALPYGVQAGARAARGNAQWHTSVPPANNATNVKPCKPAPYSYRSPSKSHGQMATCTSSVSKMEAVVVTSPFSPRSSLSLPLTKSQWFLQRHCRGAYRIVHIALDHFGPTPCAVMCSFWKVGAERITGKLYMYVKCQLWRAQRNANLARLAQGETNDASVNM